MTTTSPAPSLQTKSLHCYCWAAPGTWVLAMQGQIQRGLHVRLFHLWLSELGRNVIADSAFGENSLNALHAYQRFNHLLVHNITDTVLVEAQAQSVVLKHPFC